MNALVVGATSFVGRALTRELGAAGWDVAGAGRAGPLRVDVLDVASIRSAVEATFPDVIFNLAAPARGASLPDAIATQVLGAANVLDAALAAVPSPRVVLVGSAAELSEASGAYRVAKILQSRLAGLAAESYGSRAVVGRIFNVIGPGQPAGFLVSDLIARVSRGERVLTIRDGAATRDLVDVRDVASALRVLGEHADESLYDIGSGNDVTVEEVARFVGGLLDVDIETPPSALPLRERHCADTSALLALGWRVAHSWRDSITAQVRAQVPAPAGSLGSEL